MVDKPPDELPGSSTAPDLGVIGAGSWGTALAILLAGNLPHVRLWGWQRGEMEQMARARSNPLYLPGIRFPDALRIEPDLDRLVEASEAFLIVLPSHAFRSGLSQLRNSLLSAGRDPREVVIVWGTKGFEPESGQLLSEVLTDVMGRNARYAAISGPSFAGEVARGLPTALTAASPDSDIAEQVAGWFRTPSTRIYTSNDVIGVQLGGAIKNVIAIATGISDGLGFGANARAALITRGLAELTRLGKALGGRAETFMGLTGVGDLVLTCTDDQSRNRRVGLGIGAGHALEEVLTDLGQEAEGVNTARELYRKSSELAVEMPITTEVYRVLHQGRDPKQAVQALLAREPKAEDV